MFDKDIILVRLMLETIEKIQKYTGDLKDAAEFENDIESFDATIMNFIILGESISKLSDDFKDRHPQIEWRKIYAFRNVIAHDYFGLLSEEVWEIVVKSLPGLKTALAGILNN